MQNIIQYDLLISCPGDIKKEIKIVDKVIEQFNELYSNTLGINIKSRHWSKSSYAQSGDKPQEILNKQFIRNCDAAIAIMWTRFGTPTDKYGSGTEEEIEEMLASKRQVFMYFSEKPITPSDFDQDQYSRVQAFKEKYKGQGLYFSYSSDDEFRKLFFAHLSKYFLTLQRINEISNSKSAKLEIKSLANGKLINYAYVSKFKTEIFDELDEILVEIKALYEKINKNKQISKPEGSFKRIVDQTVYISEKTIDLIIQGASALSMIINNKESFFELGGLSKNFNSIYEDEEEFNGTKQQKEKYRDIMNLEKMLKRFYILCELKSCYNDLDCIEFVIMNNGTSFDEDVEISLEMPSDMFYYHHDFRIPDDDILTIFDEFFSIYDVFEINSTALFNDYRSSIKAIENSPSMPYEAPFPYIKKDYKKEYLETLDEIFDYDIYPNKDTIIIKLRFDYIKQHSSVAFPTPIFINGKNSNIKFEITSKHNPNIISGEIKVSKILEEITPLPPTAPSPPPTDLC